MLYLSHKEKRREDKTMMNITAERCKEQINHYEMKAEIWGWRLEVMGEKYHDEIKRRIASYKRTVEKYQKKLEEIEKSA